MPLKDIKMQKIEYEQLKELMKEIVVLAVQSTKQENSGIFAKIKGEIQEVIAPLTEQVKRTNGGVTELQKKVISLELWQVQAVTTAKIIIGVFTAVVLPLAFIVFSNFVQNNNKPVPLTKQDIQDILSQYEKPTQEVNLSNEN